MPVRRSIPLLDINLLAGVIVVLVIANVGLSAARAQDVETQASEQKPTQADEPSVSTNVQKMPIQLLSPESKFGESFSGKVLGQFVNQGTAVVNQLGKDAKTNFDLRVIYTFRSEGTHGVRVLHRGEADTKWLGQLKKRASGTAGARSEVRRLTNPSRLPSHRRCEVVC